VGIGYRELFLDRGGKNFYFIPCLNDTNDHISLLEKLIKNLKKSYFLGIFILEFINFWRNMLYMITKIDDY